MWSAYTNPWSVMKTQHTNRPFPMKKYSNIQMLKYTGAHIELRVSNAWSMHFLLNDLYIMIHPPVWLIWYVIITKLSFRVSNCKLHVADLLYSKFLNFRFDIFLFFGLMRISPLCGIIYYNVYYDTHYEKLKDNGILQWIQSSTTEQINENCFLLQLVVVWNSFLILFVKFTDKSVCSSRKSVYLVKWVHQQLAFETTLRITRFRKKLNCHFFVLSGNFLISFLSWWLFFFLFFSFFLNYSTSTVSVFFERLTCVS